MHYWFATNVKATCTNGLQQMLKLHAYWFATNVTATCINGLQHALLLTVLQVCTELGPSAKYKRRGMNCDLVMWLEHLTTLTRNLGSEKPESMPLPEIWIVTRWGTVCRDALFVLAWHMLMVLLAQQQVDKKGGSVAVRRAWLEVLTGLLDPEVMVQNATVAAIWRYWISHELAWTMSANCLLFCSLHRRIQQSLLMLHTAAHNLSATLPEPYQVGREMGMPEEQITAIVTRLFTAMAEYYFGRIEYLFDPPYLAAALGDSSKETRQWAANQYCELWDDHDRRGVTATDHFSLRSLHEDDVRYMASAEGDGQLSSELQEFLRQHYEPVPMSNYPCEVALGHLSDTSTQNMGNQLLQAHVKLGADSTQHWPLVITDSLMRDYHQATRMQDSAAAADPEQQLLTVAKECKQAPYLAAATREVIFEIPEVSATTTQLQAAHSRRQQAIGGQRHDNNVATWRQQVQEQQSVKMQLADKSVRDYAQQRAQLAAEDMLKAETAKQEKLKLHVWAVSMYNQHCMQFQPPSNPISDGPSPNKQQQQWKKHLLRLCMYLNVQLLSTQKSGPKMEAALRAKFPGALQMGDIPMQVDPPTERAVPASNNKAPEAHSPAACHNSGTKRHLHAHSASPVQSPESAQSPPAGVIEDSNQRRRHITFQNE